jgi:hypothetical protein
MTAEHWFLALLSFATLLYVAWSMGRIITVQRAIAQMVRELHNR